MDNFCAQTDHSGVRLRFFRGRKQQGEMYMQRLFQWLSLLCALSLLCGCNDVSKEPSQPTYRSLHFIIRDEQGAIDDADFIIIGTVTKTEIIYMIGGSEENVNDEASPMQLSYITINRSLHGSLSANEKIVVPLIGDDKTLITTDLHDVGGYFEEGEQILLFLHSWSEEALTFLKKHNPGIYRKHKSTIKHVTNYIQGIYRLDEEGNILHDLNQTGMGLFTDCATVDELAEKYGLN